MAPFLHWMNPPAGSVDMTARFEDRIAHTEAGLGQTQEQHDDDALDAFHQAFNIDVYKDMAEIDVYDLEARRNNFSRVSISDNRISTFALEYIDLCSQILQAFVPRGCRASLALKYLGGLATTMDVLQRDAFLKGSQNASADKARQPGWVVSRSKLQQLGAKSLGSRRRCRKCEKGAVYHSMEAASAHLHAEHGMGSMLEESIQVFLLPVSAAVDERLKEDCVGTLRQCRDQMISVLKEVKSIQDGLIDADGNITDPAKVPQILEESYDHYMEKVIKRRPISLARSRARAQQKLLSQMGSAIEAGITEAQKLFAASDDTEDQGDARSPPVDVGLPFFTMLIVSNLIMMPTYNHKKAVSLYEAYAKDLSRQYLRDVSRRWTRNITSVVHELSLISEFSTWQQDALSALRLVLHPETRFPVDEFEIEDEFLLWQSKQLENEQDKIRELSKWCSELIQEIDTMTELAGEDQSRSLALLVRIAIALLVLSLAASYMSIAQGDGHALIWQAVALLASSTGVFCFGATNQRLLLDWLNSA
ncbi:hypothetical protein B0I35DRAFT_412309 [Stachybotrys elegans]|uniref:Uncharacterized protein n=1 Tax=Stachybotrys elegans TaxID=80388 RepID=A0A8K0SLG1_9HYPO|nr:hypothetical protein B0I35DRAFT_412309 [Stachybotrys elegans]